MRTDAEFRAAALRARVATAWLAGEPATSIAVRLGISRGRVVAFVSAVPGLRAEREARLAAATGRLESQVLAWSQQHIGAPLTDAAAVFAVSPYRLRHILGARATLHPRRRAPQQHYRDEAILDALREWAPAHPALTASDYQAEARTQPGRPSFATVVARFGTWHNALRAAGICPLATATGRPMRWTPAALAAVLGEYFASPRTWSLADLGNWLQESEDRPSLSLVRTRLGTWPAIVEFAGSGQVAKGWPTSSRLAPTT